MVKEEDKVWAVAIMNTKDDLKMINNHLIVKTTYKRVAKCNKKVIKVMATKNIYRDSIMKQGN